jgi:hypothetical protein
VEVNTMIHVLVSSDCIADGKPSETENPVALALTRGQSILRTRWATSLKYAWVITAPEVRRPLPDRARAFLKLYKNGQRKFRPFSFDLDFDRYELARKLPRVS